MNTSSESKHLTYAPTTYARIKGFDGLLTNFLRIFSYFWIQRIIFLAFFAETPLASRTIFFRVHLIFCFPTNWTFSIRCFFWLFHTFLFHFFVFYIFILTHSALFVHTPLQRECTIALLKKIKKRKGNRFTETSGMPAFFLYSETVLSWNKNGNNQS